MQDYFTAKQLHLEETTLLSAAPNGPLIATLGIDNILCVAQPLISEEKQYNIPSEIAPTAITLAPDQTHCLLAHKETLLRFDFQSQQCQSLMQNAHVGELTALQYSPTGSFVVVGTEEGKPLVLQPRTGRREKCRPGHTQPTVQVLVSPDTDFVASIGVDQQALIYRLSAVEEPQQVARFTITHQKDVCKSLFASFHSQRLALYLPGQTYLQRVQLFDGKWQLIKSELISHENIILLAQAVKENGLVTSSRSELCVWNCRTQEKLFEVQHFTLKRTVSLIDTFFGTKDDGSLYRFKRQIRDQVQPMDIEEQSEEKIVFEDAEEQQERQISQQSIVPIQHPKKSKADKLITCLPQGPLTSATNLFEGQGFLFVSQYGHVISKLDANEETAIEVQFGLENPKKVIIARNRTLMFFDINPLCLLYASQTEVCLLTAPGNVGQNWQIPCSGVKAVALGTNWLAVATEDAVKILDFCCHQIRTIAFDREIIALRAYQNLLAIVYHESVPMWGAQQLAMQLVVVDSTSAHFLPSVPVPLKPGSILRSLHFSSQGMLISQDTSGTLRAFSLERADWTTVSPEGLQDSRKAWIIGVHNNQLLYWKTSSEDPEPTVSPRFDIQTASLYIPTIGSYPENVQEVYERLLWNRFTLDHEKARARLWGRLKISRQENSVYWNQINSIIGEKEIAVKHSEIDEKFISIISGYLKLTEYERAIWLIKTSLRTMEGIKRAEQLLESYGRRQESIVIQSYRNEKQRELQYEQMQTFEFVKIREQAQKIVKPSTNDIMKKPSKKPAEQIPSFSQSLSQQSLSVKLSQSNASVQSKISTSQQQPDVENPFLKRKSTNESFEARKKEISDHVEKFGIRKKVDEKVARRKI